MISLSKRDDDLEYIESVLFGIFIVICVIFILVVVGALIIRFCDKKPDPSSNTDATPKDEINLDSSETYSNIPQVPTKVYTPSIKSGISSSESIDTHSAHFQELPNLEAVGVQKYTCCEWCAIQSDSNRGNDRQGRRPS